MKRLLFIALLIIAALAWAYSQRIDPASHALTAFGTLEARNIDIGSKVGGRVLTLGTHEGEQVHAGQVLVTLDDEQLAPAVALAEAQLAQARAELAKREHGSRVEDIAEARAAASDQAGGGFRADEIAEARADRARLAADARNAERRLARSRDLLARRMISEQAHDDAETAADAAHAALSAAAHALAAAEGRYDAARAVTARTVSGYRVEDIAAARAAVTEREAELALARARLAETVVRAPSDATVEVFDVRPGDLLAPNAPVARLLESAELYVIVYVPEPRIGEVRLGQHVEIAVDTFPERRFRGRVEQIRQRAEFLPRNVQTREERVHQVIGVKVRVEEGRDELRAGTTAEVRFPPRAP